jgi:hypothetical protein
MPAVTKSVPDALVDLALNTLDDEVKRWRRVPWRPGWIRLMRYSESLDAGPGDVVSEDATITVHDVPERMADDMIVRFAMEKVLEVAIGAISVAPPAPKPRRPRKKAAKA